MTSEHLESISSWVDELALKSIMLEPNDVGAMGDLLNLLDRIRKHDTSSAVIGELCCCLTALLEAIILRQDTDLSRHMPAVPHGVTLLQNALRAIKSGESPAPDLVSGFMEKLDPLAVDVDFGDNRYGEPGETVSEPSLTLQTDSDRPSDSPGSPEEPKNVIIDAETCYEFIAETLGNLENVEPLVVELEEDPGNKEIINAIFRCFHTAKGVSGFLNLQRMNRYTHELENLLDEVRNDRISFDRRIADFVLESFDFLRNLLEQVRALMDQGLLYEPDYAIEEAVASIQSLLASDTTLGGPSVAQDEPSLLGEILVDMKRTTQEDVDEALALQNERPESKLGEILTESGRVSPRDVEDALRKQRTIETTIRVSTEKLDQMVDMVGELVIAQTLVAEHSLIQQTKDQKFVKDFSQLHRITSELQKTAMSMRMVLIRQTFQKMVRLVRDLSRKSGKQVELQMFGEDTEIDRNMVDEIYDPLVHMVRNAMDHGLETSEERIAAGKPPVGQLQLRAYHQGGSLFIDITDDGRGLNRDRILKKALDRGLVAPKTDYTDHEIYNFIFLPGFSTAEAITDISGRGVGMDVVKKFVEKIRGSVEIKSRPGKGSTFTIKLPLTLAIIDGIVALVGVERYIIPAQSVRESLQAAREQFVTVSGRGEAVNMRGKILPLIRLHKIFGIPTERIRPEETILIVVEHEGKEAGLMVDDLVGKQEVVIKSLGHRLRHVPGFSGGTILGDGRVGLILDISGLFQIFSAS